MTRVLVLAVVLLTFGSTGPAAAEQPRKIPRIGFLRPGSASGSPQLRMAFQQGLRDLGYIEGQTSSWSIDMQILALNVCRS